MQKRMGNYGKIGNTHIRSQADIEWGAGRGQCRNMIKIFKKQYINVKEVIYGEIGFEDLCGKRRSFMEMLKIPGLGLRRDGPPLQKRNIANDP